MLIITRRFGQLCNRLFQFSHFYAFSKKHNVKVIHPNFYPYAKYFDFDLPKKYIIFSFPLFAVVKMCDKFIRRFKINNRLLRSFQYDNDTHYDPNDPLSVKELKKSIFTFVSGEYFRDYKNFAEYASDIKEYFKPLPRHSVNIKNLMENIREKTDIIIGIHLRRGDYSRYKNGRYFYPDEIYLDAMKKAHDLFRDKRTGFLLCSNEKIDMRKFRNSFEHVFQGTNHIVEDLYAFSKCDYLIGPPSTYTMWASFYGDVPLYILKDTDKEINLRDFRIIVNGYTSFFN